MSLVVIFAGCGSEPVSNNEESQNATAEEQVEEELTWEEQQEKALDEFVDEFNSNSSMPLVFVEKFVPKDKDGSHYRRVYRLTPYMEAVGKSFTYDGLVFDVVSYGPELVHDEPLIGIIVDYPTKEQCKEIIPVVARIMDETVPDDEIQRILDKMDEAFFFGDYIGDISIITGYDDTDSLVMDKE